jgi:cytochrome c biogenesis factor
MTDEFDPKLQALFAETRPVLDSEEFIARVRARLTRERRQQQIYTVLVAAAAVAAAIASTPVILSGTDVVVNSITSVASGVSGGPAAWLLSLLIGGGVLWRLRVFRR